GGGAQHGAGGGGSGGAHAVGKADEQAEPVKQPFEIAAGGGEPVGCLHVRDQHGAQTAGQAAHGGQGGDRMRQGVQTLERGDQVIGTAVGPLGDVEVVHVDPVGQACRRDVAPGQIDRGHVKVVAVHVDHRVAAGKSDARPPCAAADVGHAGRWAGA